jgi:hypothetical protein
MIKSKGFISFVIVAASLAFVWVLIEGIGQMVLGGANEFVAWRADHMGMVLVIWIAGSLVIMVPALVVVGRRMAAQAAEREQELAEAKGIGRLLIQALRGNEAAADKLVLLLKNPSRPVRLQAARALAMLDDEDVNPTLFRIVRYWSGDDKLKLIDVLERTNDIRMAKLLNELAADRSPFVARKARAALPLVLGRARRGVPKEQADAAPAPAPPRGKPRPGEAATSARPASDDEKRAGAPVRKTAGAAAAGGKPGATAKSARPAGAKQGDATKATRAAATEPDASGRPTSEDRPRRVRPAKGPARTATPVEPRGEPEAPLGS